MKILDNVDKFRNIIYRAFRVLLIITALFALWHFHWKEIGYLMFILFLTYLPRRIESRIGIDYPGEVEILILFFIIGSIYLGEMHSYYDKYPWWDMLLHSMSAIVIGGIGFSIVFILNESKKIVFKLSPLFVSVFAFCFAVSIGVVWEIFEFAMDQTFGLRMQKSGLMDTMGDLIVDCLGALFFSIFGYFHLRKQISLFQRLEKKFFKLNPELKKG